VSQNITTLNIVCGTKMNNPERDKCTNQKYLLVYNSKTKLSS